MYEFVNLDSFCIGVIISFPIVLLAIILFLFFESVMNLIKFFLNKVKEEDTSSEWNNN